MILRFAAMAAAVTLLAACSTTSGTQANAPAAPASTATAAAAPAPAAEPTASSAALAQVSSNQGRRCDNVTGTRVKAACSNAPVQTGNQDTARQLIERSNPSVPPGQGQ